MGFLCKIKGHKWQGCVCARCKQVRDEGHEKTLADGVCMYKCKKCGKILEEASHSWRNPAVIGLGEETCKCHHCGTARDSHHQFKLIDGSCQEKCVHCGKIRNVAHKWAGNRCVLCGITCEGGTKDELQDLCALIKDKTVSNDKLLQLAKGYLANREKGLLLISEACSANRYGVATQWYADMYQEDNPQLCTALLDAFFSSVGENKKRAINSAAFLLTSKQDIAVLFWDGLVKENKNNHIKGKEKWYEGMAWTEGAQSFETELPPCPYKTSERKS